MPQLSHTPLLYRIFLLLAALFLLLQLVVPLIVLAGLAYVLAWVRKSRNWIFMSSLCLGWLVFVAASPVIKDMARIVLPVFLGEALPQAEKIASRLGMLLWVGMVFMFSTIGGRSLPVPGMGNPHGLVRAPLLFWGAPIPAWQYTAIAIVVSTLCFVPGMEWKADLLGWSILFALVNAPLEELLWRGCIQAGIIRALGSWEGILWTGLLFGCNHAMLGFPWWTCLAFGAGGLVFGVLARESKGLALPVAFHISLNICFGMRGMLFGP